MTSQRVLDVEADLVARLAQRGREPAGTGGLAAVAGLDTGQRAAVAVLASDAPLVLVEGAAGSGKTTTLAAAREQLDRRDRRMVVVTPTLKAAHAASTEIGARAGTAAWLAYQYGWRWDQTGSWDRQPARQAPDAILHSGDLLLVDLCRDRDYAELAGVPLGGRRLVSA